MNRLPAHLSRREVIRGALAFLGYTSLMNVACTSAPEEGGRFRQFASPFQSAWSPPPEVLEVGKAILSISSDVPALLEELTPALDSLNRPKADLADAIRSSHLSAAASERWVDVRGWRLSSVEAAAYVLCALSAR